jgi:hypothetical protein
MFVLVDYENVGPGLRACAISEDAQVLVFLGKTNAKIHPHISRWLGNRAEYISMEGQGPNALDFHISYYMGNILAHNSDAVVTIISGDKGFDPLVRHLTKSGRNVKRVEPQRQRTPTYA